MFNLQLEMLSIKKMSHEEMSSRQMYLIQTPVRLYIWLGAEVEQIKRLASLKVMHSFMSNKLEESLLYKPGY